MSVIEDVLGKVVEKAVGGDADKAKVAGPELQADSWIGKGGNEPISGDQARELIGSEKVARIAEDTGLPPDRAADLIAEALPEVVDEVSPEGEQPLADELGAALESLKR